MGREGSRDEDADVRNAVIAGLKSAFITFTVTSASVALAVRHSPKVKANLNHTGRALVICGASLFMFGLRADQATLKTQKKNARYE